MTSIPLPPTSHYIRLALAPPLPAPDGLALRKTLETAMSQSFGISRAATYMDVLWLADDGGEAVVRVGIADAEAVKAAVAVTSRMRVVRDGGFLPALLADDWW